MHQPVIVQRLEALAVFVACLCLYAYLGFNWLLFIALLLVFDIFMLGYAVSEKVGAISYNIGHSFVPPAMLVIAGVVFETQLLVALSIIWCAHIGLDRALGYGLKYPGGFTKTHLGMIGPSKKKGPLG
jgi:hypothetical protein